MTTNTFASNLQWVAMARETTNGTPISTPATYVPSDTPTYVPNNSEIFVDQALRGFMGTDFGQQLGLNYDTLTYKTWGYLDSVFPHILAILGYPDTVTGSSDPYTHKTTLYNGSGTDGAQPHSYTMFYNDGAGKCFQIAGAIPSTVKIVVKTGGFVEVDVTWIGLPAAQIAVPTNTPTTAKPMPAWNSTFTIGGTAFTKYSEIDLEYKRDTKMVPTITGSRTPYAIFAGPLSVTFSLTGVYQGYQDTDYVAYLANTQPVLLVKIAPNGDATHSLSLQHSVATYDLASFQQNGDMMEIKATGKALMNSTDIISGSGMSPVLATLLTPVSTAY